MIKKILTISLLLLWVFQGLWLYLCYDFQRQDCYADFTERKSELQTQYLQTFSFSKDNPIIWEKEGKEFLWNEVLYDVVSIEKNRDNIIITCISDEREYSLINMFHEFFQDMGLPIQAKKIKFEIIKFVLTDILAWPTYVFDIYTYVCSQQTFKDNRYLELYPPPPEIYCN